MGKIKGICSLENHGTGHEPLRDFRDNWNLLSSIVEGRPEHEKGIEGYPRLETSNEVQTVQRLYQTPRALRNYWNQLFKTNT